MKFKLVEYPYGKEIGFKQDIVWFIQGTDEVVKVEFPAISFVKLPNGQELSVYVHFNENNRPIFSVPEDVLKMYIEENK